ncbi:hypothetical protein, partial [Nostoc sp.]|uniref:hypothetical protein n=1 Tax=Nostoc sp. TaxID=1180 RepID=UPI002FF93B07
PCWRQSRQEQHFQPEAGNEVLKGFALKLTPMSNTVPLRQVWFKGECVFVRRRVGGASQFCKYTKILAPSPYQGEGWGEVLHSLRCSPRIGFSIYFGLVPEQIFVGVK